MCVYKSDDKVSAQEVLEMLIEVAWIHVVCERVTGVGVCVRECV